MITEQRNDFIELLREKPLSIPFVPVPFSSSHALPAANNQDYDQTLAALSTNLANDYLHRKSLSSVPQVKDQVSCLGYLLFSAYQLNPVYHQL